MLLILLSFYIGHEYVKTFGLVQAGGLLASAENLRLFILSYGRFGYAIMVALQALQVIVSFIPAALVLFASGFIYGTGLGMLSGIVGIALGTACSFYIARLLGRRVVTLFVSEKNLRKLDGLATGNRAALVLLLLFILPTPKDFLPYIAGLTNIRAGSFFLISAVGRLPGMLISAYLGAHILQRNYLLLGLMVAISAAAALLFFIYREKILGLANKKEKD
jgi:uncharacterized membrane protein YdjX (TVP38/TMEM64 family)